MHSYSEASRSLASLFKRVLGVIWDAGMTLTGFAESNEVSHPQETLFVLYTDILDLCTVLVKGLVDTLGPVTPISKRHLLLECSWPGTCSSIARVRANVEQHKKNFSFFRQNAAGTPNIQRINDNRKHALLLHNRRGDFHNLDEFQIFRNEVNPHTYEDTLDNILRRTTMKPGEWLESEFQFLDWRNAANTTVRHIWLYGNPGCGK